MSSSQGEKRDKVHVMCRFRPMSEMEKSQETQGEVARLSKETVEFDLASVGKQHNDPTKIFTFDRVFGELDDQEVVYNEAAKPLCEDVMNGFNCTVFAYGQTGSGKTYTMMGVPNTSDEGIIPRLAEGIFDQMEIAEDSLQFTVKISYVEIYMERIHDLLNPKNDNLRIREGNRGVWIEDVEEQYVSSVDELLNIMRKGDHNRAVASTNMNERSSRSHSVFIMTVGQHDQFTGSKKGSKLILVDLAGSETVKKTGSTGVVLKEAQHINRSLSALGNVINSLTSKSSHIPYRDSKLTRLLSDSLGGNSKTILIITASPAMYNAPETLSTLRFGHRAKQIQNRPIANEEKSVAEYRALLEAALNKVAEQEELLNELQEEVNILRGGGTIDEKLRSTSRANRRNSIGLVNDLEMQTKVDNLNKTIESNEAVINTLQVEIEDKMVIINELQDILNAREEEMSALEQKIKDKDSASQMESNQEKKRIKELEKRIDIAETEQQQYLQRIDKLQQENLELAEMNDVNLSSIATVARKPVPPPANLTAAEIKIWEMSQKAALEVGIGIGDMDLLQQVDTLRKNYDVLMAALGRKCEAYIELQMNLERAEEQLKRAQHMVTSGATHDKLADYEKRVKESEELSQRLYQSGLYWQQRCQRKDALLREREERDRIMALQNQRWNINVPQEESPAQTLMSGVQHLKPKHEGDDDDEKAAEVRRRATSSARVIVPRLIQGGRQSALNKKNRGKTPKRQDSMDNFF